MNALKTVVILGVLGVVGYGVYMAINNNPTTPPPGVANDFNQLPQVEMPGTSGGMSLPMPNTAGSYDPLVNTQSGGLQHSFDSASNQSGIQTPHFGHDQIPPKAGDSLPNPGGTYPNLMTGTVEPAREYRTTTSGQLEPGGVYNPHQALGNTQVPSTYDDLMGGVHATLREGRLAEAHESLSRLYSRPDLPPSTRKQVTDLLGQVAGTVIYSRQHILEQPYIVRPGDTLQQVAQTYRVPWQMLAKINGFDNSNTILQPGEQLKVLHGPFAAEIRLSDYQLTLRLGHRYAGRFQVGIGGDHVNLEGNYEVQDKYLNPAYRGPDGMIAADNPANPLGERLIGLKSQTDPYGIPVAIHGTNDPQSVGRMGGTGSIRLSNRDIDDLYNILSVGSKVTILR